MSSILECLLLISNDYVYIIEVTTVKDVPYV